MKRKRDRTPILGHYRVTQSRHSGLPSLTPDAPAWRHCPASPRNVLPSSVTSDPRQMAAALSARAEGRIKEWRSSEEGGREPCSRLPSRGESRQTVRQGSRACVMRAHRRAATQRSTNGEPYPRARSAAAWQAPLMPSQTPPHRPHRHSQHCHR